MKYVLGELNSIWTTLSGKANTAHIHTISDVTALQSTLDGKSNTGHSHAISSVSGLQTALDSKPTLQGGKLPTSYLEQVNIGETYEVASEAAMLALQVSPGDVAIRQDTDGLFMLRKSPASNRANWWDLTAAMSGIAGVTSWNGQTGVVTAGAADVGAVPVGRTISPGTGLTGGGDLSTNRILRLSPESQASLVKADTAVQGFTNGTSTAFKLEKLTAAQYAALSTKDANTWYAVVG